MKDTVLSGNKVLTKFVPAVAVIQTVRVYLGFTGCKGCVGGLFKFCFKILERKF